MEEKHTAPRVIDISRITLPVSGMTCAACVARVEKSLNKIEGLQNITVNIATNAASFDISNTLTSEQSIQLSELIEQKISKLGYEIDTTRLTNPEVPQELTPDLGVDEKLYNRFLVALLLSIPISILNMSSMFSWYQNSFPLLFKYTNPLLMVMTLPVLIYSGKVFFIGFYKNAKQFAADMNSLVAIGTGVAYLYSVAVTLFPHYFMHAGGGSSHAGTYYDTSVVIITLILMGKFLEDRAKKKTLGELQKIMELKPTSALVKRNGIEIEIPISELLINDSCISKPGSKIAADGIVTAGNSEVDESILTGESLPVFKQEGHPVTGGSLNISGTIEYRITALGDRSVLGKIIKMVQDAQGSKAPIQNLADKVAAIFVPVVILIAIITFFAWNSPFANAPFVRALINMVAVLIIACPCSLGLATPTAIIVGTGLAARHGILIKNGRSLETAHKITTVVFDKTGTLTEGKLFPVEIKSTNKIQSDEMFLTVLGSLESKSEHPIAKAIVSYSNRLVIQYKEVVNFKNHVGKGIEGEIENSLFYAGKAFFVLEFLKEEADIFQIKSIEESALGTVVYLATDGMLLGYILLQDTIRLSAPDVVKRLKNNGIKSVMLTGDNRATAKDIADRIGIEQFFSGVLPGEKADKIRELIKQGEIVAMVGDGINDAPALAASDLSISLSSATDVAIETAEITLMTSDLSDVATAIELSKKTIRIIKQNLFWSFVYNSIGIPIAALGLLDPMFAAFAMSLSSVSVVSNSLRIRRFKFR